MLLPATSLRSGCKDLSPTKMVLKLWMVAKKTGGCCAGHGEEQRRGIDGDDGAEVVFH